ncbi:hypothetical protein DRH14_04800, partial [Candidatus Shapirobacteria bacterium]
AFSSLRTFFFVTIFIVFAIKPAVSTISALVGEIQAKETLSKRMSSKINNMVNAQDQFSQIQEKYQLIEASLPTYPRFNHALIQTKNMAYQAGMVSPQIKFNINQDKDKTEKNDPKTQLSSYSLSLSNNGGDFSQAPIYLQKLYQNRRLMKINKIELGQYQSRKSTQHPKEEITLSTQINIKVYYWPEEYEKTKNL